MPKQITLLGGSVSQVRTVSYGEEHPDSPGHDESAYSLNRRVVISDEKPCPARQSAHGPARCFNGLCLCVMAQYEAPIVEDNPPSVEARLGRLERLLTNRGMLDLLDQVERLHQEVKRLRGRWKSRRIGTKNPKSARNDCIPTSTAGCKRLKPVRAARVIPAALKMNLQALR